VGSRVDGFVAHVATFRTIEYYDIRPITKTVPNIVFRQGDLLQPDSFPCEACDSLSSLHVIEHVGLGRYGDRIEPAGWRMALRNLATMLAAGGTLYLSVPIGRQRIEFNAHRIFAPAAIVAAGSALDLRLEHFAWVDDEGELHDPSTGTEASIAAAENLRYGCGIYEFRKTRSLPKKADRPTGRTTRE
jgi:hypothetical protein